MTLFKYLLLGVLFITSSCIGDDFIEDFVEPTIRLTNIPQSIAADTVVQISPSFFNNVGQESETTFTYESDSEGIFTISESGLLTPVADGQANLIVSTSFEDVIYSSSTLITISEVTVNAPTGKVGTINTTSSYKLMGSMTIEEVGEALQISIADDYEASTALPGLYVYLTNNRNTTAGALEIGKVEVFEGEHTYSVPGVRLEDYSHILYFCKPFGVKVGDGAFE